LVIDAQIILDFCEMKSIRTISLFWILFVIKTFGQDQRPNVLWLTFEDTSPEFVGCYGNPKAKTPFMDSLASVGIRFTRAFSTGAVCSPSRTALITGMKTYTLGTGHHRSQYSIPSFVKGFPYYLKEAGYYCTNNEKTDYNVADPKAFIANTWDESSNKAGWWNRKDGQPFFAVVNNMSAHQSRTMTNSYSDYEKMVLNKLPQNLKVSENELIMPPFYRDSPEMRINVARLYNSIALADYEMKKTFERLKKDNLLDNTIIFCFADHGEGMPRVKTNGIGLGHRVPFFVWLPEKYKHLIATNTGTSSDQLIDFCDLPPTILALAGVDIPKHFQGKNILQNQKDLLFLSSDRSDESTDLTRTVISKKYAYSRVFMPFMQEVRYLNYMDQGDITAQIRKDFKDKKLNQYQEKILVNRDSEYLFDLENDTWEINNLANNPKYNKVLEQFRKQLQNHLIEQKDVMFLPEGRFNEVQKNTTLYEFRNNEKAYPIEQIVKTAMFSGLKTDEAIKAQINALSNPNETVQYWAAMGLRGQETSNLKKNLSQIEKHLSSPSNYVGALVSLALSNDLKHKGAVERLKSIILSDDEYATYLAIQGLMYLTSTTDYEQVVSQFLEKRKGQKRFLMAINSAKMYQYVIGKTKINEIEE
jgi:arylsulfatase A-like enzyme